MYAGGFKRLSCASQTECAHKSPRNTLEIRILIQQVQGGAQESVSDKEHFQVMLETLGRGSHFERQCRGSVRVNDCPRAAGREQGQKRAGT